jgi:hypothetical protein
MTPFRVQYDIFLVFDFLRIHQISDFFQSAIPACGRQVQSAICNQSRLTASLYTLPLSL